MTQQYQYLELDSGNIHWSAYIHDIIHDTRFFVRSESGNAMVPTDEFVQFLGRHEMTQQLMETITGLGSGDTYLNLFFPPAIFMLFKLQFL